MNAASLTPEQQEIIDLLCGEIADLRVDSEADSNDLLARLDPLAGAAELAGLIGLAAATRCLINNLTAIDFTDLNDDVGTALQCWPVLWSQYLRSLGGDEASAITAIIDLLSQPCWSKALTRDQRAELGTQFERSSLTLIDDKALPTTVTADMLSLAVSEDVRPELLDGMLVELPQQVRQFEQSIAAFLESRDVADLTAARRLAHTLKGAANIVGVQGIANLMHGTEDLLEIVAKHSGTLPADFGSLLQDVADTLAAMGECLCGLGPVPADSAPVLQAVFDCFQRFKHPGDVTQAIEATVANGIAATADDVDALATAEDLLFDLGEFDIDAGEQHDKAQHVAASPVPAPHQTPQANAAEQEDEQHVLTLSHAMAQELLRIAGESQISNARVAAHVDAMAGGVKSAERYHQQIKAMATQLEVLVQTQSALRAAAMQFNDGELDPIELERYSELHTFAHQLLELTTDASEAIGQIDEQLRQLSAVTYAQHHLNKSNQGLLLRLRMVAVSMFESRFARCVRQACRLTTKSARFELLGGQVLVDSVVLNRIVDPLLHLLRNAVDHGLERSDARVAAGKPAEGVVRLIFEQRGETLTIQCQDDGAGLNLAKIRERAIANGWLSEAQSEDAKALEQVILLPGFTTRHSATQTSGRGIGLDTVVSEVKALKGSLSLTSQAGQGCCFTLQLPTSILTGHALLLRCSSRQVSQTLCVVTRNIEQIVYAKNAELQKCEAGVYFALGDENLPVHALHDLVNLFAVPNNHTSALLIIRNGAGERIAIAVEAVLASQDLVVKPLNRFAYHPPGVVGATILGDGTVAPVIDLQELPGISGPVEAITPRRARAANLDAETPVATALIVDDSLSARRSLAQFVSDLGLDVMTAKDGFEAINAVDRKRPSLILVDMEMPRMNGLELTAHLRSRTDTRDIPVIMITSRSAEKHRRLAFNAGVDSYLTKPWSEEELFTCIEQRMISFRGGESVAATAPT